LGFWWCALRDERAIQLFLVDGEPWKERRIQQALERQGMQSEVSSIPRVEPRRDAGGPTLELDHLRDLLIENQRLITTGRLAASIAHEINNPLEAVTNLLYLLRSESGLTPEGRGFLVMAQAELTRVAQISKQVLNFNRETPHPVRVEPCGLLEDVLGLYTRRAEEKRITIRREYLSDSVITAFPGEIRQVFSNLITNAIEATAPGGRIRVRVRPARLWSDSGQRGLRITIADTGSGIPLHVRRRLGEPFFTTKGQHGTGIGLWLSQSIVLRYAGNLQVWSSTLDGHHGTVFSVFLPTNLRPAIVEPTQRDVA
jgi:signal transduction histidine kinase